MRTLTKEQSAWMHCPCGWRCTTVDGESDRVWADHDRQCDYVHYMGDFADPRMAVNLAAAYRPEGLP